MTDELYEIYDEIKEDINKAEESDTPFPIVKDDQIAVVGDANKTEINQHDFKIVFKMPKGFEGGTETPTGVLVEKEYKDVFITPRRSVGVIAALAKLLPFFRKYSDKGGVEEYTDEELLMMLNDLDTEMIDAMYNFVAKVLGIDEKLIDYIQPSSVMNATAQIIKNYPEIVNEADVFFD